MRVIKYIKKVRKFSDEELIELHSKGMSDRKIANYFGCNPSTIWERRAKLGLTANYIHPFGGENLTEEEILVSVKKRVRNASTHWRRNNPKKSKSKWKKYRKENRKFLNEHDKKYYVKNRKKMINKTNEWVRKNRDKWNKYQREYRRKKQNKPKVNSISLSQKNTKEDGSPPTDKSVGIRA